MVQESLAQRLRAERIRRGLTLVQAAEGAQIDRHTLSRVEKGIQVATGPTLSKLATFYELAPSDIAALETEPPKEEPPAPSDKEPIVVRMKWEEPRREAFGEFTVINRVYISDEELERLREDGIAWGTVNPEGEGSPERVGVQVLLER